MHPDVVAIVDHYFPFPTSRFRRYFGVVITHHVAALYTARRNEMMDVLERTLFYLNRSALPQVHSPVSELPFQRILRMDMPTLSFFDLLRESDYDFLHRTGWEYSPDSPVDLPTITTIVVKEPYHRRPGGGPASGSGGSSGLAAV